MYGQPWLTSCLQGKQAEFMRECPTLEEKGSRGIGQSPLPLKDLTYFCPRPTPPFAPISPSPFFLALPIFLSLLDHISKNKSRPQNIPAATQHPPRLCITCILPLFTPNISKVCHTWGVQFCYLVFTLQSNPIWLAGFHNRHS